MFSDIQTSTYKLKLLVFPLSRGFCICYLLSSKMHWIYQFGSTSISKFKLLGFSLIYFIFVLHYFTVGSFFLHFNHCFCNNYIFELNNNFMNSTMDEQLFQDSPRTPSGTRQYSPNVHTSVQAQALARICNKQVPGNIMSYTCLQWTNVSFS